MTMQLSEATEPRLPHLIPEYLEDVKQSSQIKFTQAQYDYIIGRIESSLDVITRSMLNSYDRGFGFLKLAIHNASTQAGMQIIYEKVINQTPWKYRRTVLAFIEAIDTIFKFASKSPVILEKLHIENNFSCSDQELLMAISELTINYITRLIEQEKTYLAS